MDIGISDRGRDVIIEHNHDGLQLISDLHRSFMTLQYPLLFLYGEACFHLTIPYAESPVCEIFIENILQYENGMLILYDKDP